jgi:hypothetical protein
MQSLGLAEVAYQNAAAYAKERVQGRSLRGPQQPDKSADTILVHPDVRRLLLSSRAYTEAGRALTCWTALLTDQSLSHPDATTRKDSEDLIALLTPVVKAFITDNTLETTSHCMQVLGGHGYIAEWGMEQYLRDARINTIYEGTNAIQALDLLGRKVLHDNGEKFGKFATIVQGLIKEHTGNAAMAEFLVPLGALLGDIVKLTTELGAKAKFDPDEIGAAATPYLRLLGHLTYAWLWARMARIAQEHAGDAFYDAKLATARFYYARLLPETAALLQTARSGAANLMTISADAL